MRVLLLLASLRVAMACSCTAEAYNFPLCARIDQVKVLFVGTAVETNDSLDGFIKGGVWYRFTVEEAFKGVAPGVKEVIVDPASGTSCQSQFKLGKRYLVSSYGDTLAAQQSLAISIGFPKSTGRPRPEGSVVSSGVCSGSQEVEHAEESLRFLRQYTSKPGPASIVGNVRVHADEWLWSNRHPPVEGAEIEVTGPDFRRTVKTGGDGRYELADVPPGTYRLMARAPGMASARPHYPIQVPAHGCGFANIGMYSDGALSGEVVEQDGKPVVGVQVEYRRADPKLDNPWPRERSTRTNAEGRFTFVRVPPGEFLVGVHLDSAPKVGERILPTYVPGVTDVAKAHVVRLAPNELRTDLRIVLGPRAGTRKVRVEVRWEDGRPAAGLVVNALVGSSYAEEGETNASGDVVMPLLDGLAYRFQARAWTSYRTVNGNRIPDKWVDAKPEKLEAGSSDAVVRLMLAQ